MAKRKARRAKSSFASHSREKALRIPEKGFASIGAWRSSKTQKDALKRFAS